MACRINLTPQPDKSILTGTVDQMSAMSLSLIGMIRSPFSGSERLRCCRLPNTSGEGSTYTHIIYACSKVALAEHSTHAFPEGPWIML